MKSLSNLRFALCPILCAVGILLTSAQTGLAQTTTDKPTIKSSLASFTMKRSNGLGLEILEASKDGVRISYPQANFYVVTRAPEWQVSWFSPANKTVFTQTLAKFRADKGLPTRCVQLPAPAANTLYTHVKAIKISKKVDPRDAMTDFRGLPGYSHKEPSPTYTDYYFSEPSNLPTEALAFITTFFGTPNFGCVPLAMDVRQEDGTIRKSFFTTEIRNAPISPKQFEIPRGYRPVASRFNVTAGGGYGKDMNSLLDDMKLGEEFGTSTKKK